MRSARNGAPVVNQPWDGDSEQWLDDPPAWVRWTTGTALTLIAAMLFIPYAWWVRLAVGAGVVIAAGMLHFDNAS
jgi:hypothetical protein